MSKKNKVSKAKFFVSSKAKRFKNLRFSKVNRYNRYPETFFNTFLRPLTKNLYKSYGHQRAAAKDQLRAHLRLSRFQRRLTLASVKARTPLVHHASPLNYLILFLKKSYLKQQTQRTLWRGRQPPRGVKQFRYFRQIERSRLLPRLSQRILKLPVFRLRFFYMFDIFILWVYFFFKKIAHFIKLFFYAQWCNLYFFLASENYWSFFSPAYLKLGLVTLSRDFFENYTLAIKVQAASVASTRFSILTSYCFTSFFKQMCLFWNKRKYKHFLFRIPSRRWRRKFRSLKRKGRRKKYIPFWKRIKTTKFFTPRKILRLKFRRQHGFKTISNYGLRAQLRGFKPKRKKNRPSRRAYSQRPLRAISDNAIIYSSLVNARILKPHKVYKLNNYVIAFLENRRKYFLRGLATHSFVQASYVRREKIFLEHFCKKLQKLSSSSFIMIALAYLNHLSSSACFNLRNNKELRPNNLTKLFYGEKLWSTIFYRILGHFATVAETPDFNALSSKFNTIDMLPTPKQKKMQKQGLVNLSFAQLYDNLITHKIKARRLAKAKRRSKNRKIKAGVNRRKLLLAVKFKIILPKARKAPLFCFRMPKTTKGI